MVLGGRRERRPQRGAEPGEGELTLRLSIAGEYAQRLADALIRLAESLDRLGDARELARELHSIRERLERVERGMLDHAYITSYVTYGSWMGDLLGIAGAGREAGSPEIRSEAIRLARQRCRDAAEQARRLARSDPSPVAVQAALGMVDGIVAAIEGSAREERAELSRCREELRALRRDLEELARARPGPVEGGARD